MYSEDNNQRPCYSYEGYAHASSKDGEADAIVVEIPYIKTFLSKYSGNYPLFSSQNITSSFVMLVVTSKVTLLCEGVCVM